MKRILITAAAFACLTCHADFYSIDFSGYKTGNVVELTPVEIMELNTGTKNLVKSIPVCHNVGRSYHASHGGLSISTPSAQDPGEITFELNPELAVIAKAVNIIGYRFSRFEETGNDHESEVEVKLNSGSYQTGKLGNDRTGNAFFSITAGDEPLTSISLRLPASEYAKGDASYEITLEQITISYEASSNNGTKKVTRWDFPVKSDIGYMDSSESYVMPMLEVAPEVARFTAVYSSSNPDVAEFVDGQLKLKEHGKTIIKATIGPNMIFDTKSQNPAEYELTVDESGNVPGNIFDIDITGSCKSELFDLTGKKVGAEPAPGIYIERASDGTVRKIIK